MKFITPNQFAEFEKEYFAGKYYGQRFGQAFRNNLTADQWTAWVLWMNDNKELECEIFYSTDVKKVRDIIWKNLVKVEE